MTRNWLARLVSLVALTALCGCGRQEPAAAGAGGKRGPMAFPVEVAAVQARDVEYVVQAVGSVEAFERVQITARVPGAVEQVRFAEGDVVEPGAVLVEIEPQRYRLAVASAKAALARARAAVDDARSGLKRRETAARSHPGLLPAEEIETFRTRVRSSEAEAAQARVALDRASLDLRDALVRAPMAGEIQTRTVQTGQYVQPGAVLATLVRRDPLLLRFQVPEPEAARLSLGATARFQTRGDAEPRTARITHVAAVADEGTRMVRVTAEVDPAHREGLRPGAFAEVQVPVGSSGDGPVIPQRAVRPTERGFEAYVVEDGKARARVLELGLRTADGLIEVRSGLKPGEQLVVRGAEALKEGAAVKVAQGGGERPAVGAGAAAGKAAGAETAPTAGPGQPTGPRSPSGFGPDAGPRGGSE